MRLTRLGLSALGGLLALSVMRPLAAADDDLLAAVRNDDARAARTLLTGGADPNAGDDIGATPLMHAAAFSSLETLRVLLDARAEVNAATKAGATALMWATGDLTKVRLLLDRGADVNARMRDGTTALVTAARRGNLDVMRLLLARGSEPKSAPSEMTELLRAAFGERPEVRQVLEENGLFPPSVPPLGGPVGHFPSGLG